jgi:hypothetical protein
MRPTECSEMIQTIYQSRQQNITEQGRHKPEAISLEERFMSIQYRQASSNIYQWVSLLHQTN